MAMGHSSDAGEFGAEIARLNIINKEGAGRSATLGIESIAARRRRLLGTTSASIDSEVANVVSFRGKRELLRASDVSTVMRCFAAVLSQSDGSADTYALSEEVSSIDLFLSHNWEVSRAQKFLCLALHFNLYPALRAVVATIAAIATAEIFGACPLVLEAPVSVVDPDAGVVKFCPLCTFLVTPVFLFVLLFGHEFRRLIGFRGIKIFLDKTCINQVDREVQKDGIRKIGAFLRNSSKMVVIYTDLYLTKLWTVYEIACFLSLHPYKQLVVLPTYQPIVIFGGAATYYVAAVSNLLLGSQHARLALFINIAVNGLAWCALAALLRHRACAKEAIRERVTEFRMEHCKCRNEDDRPLVHQNIALLMRATGEVDKDAASQVAIDAFNGVVRKLAGSLTASIGPLSLGYLQVVSAFMCSVMPVGVDISLSGVLPYPEDWVARYRVCSMVYYATGVFGILPLLIAFLSKWCSCCFHLRRFQEWALLGTGVGLTWALYASLMISARYLQWVAVKDGLHRDAFAVGQVVLLASSTSLAIIVFTRG